MGFVERAFTPPGGAPLGSAANPLPMPTPAPVAAPPPPPTLPTAPAPPPIFQPGLAPGAKQRAATTATTMLGAAATTGQTARPRATLLGA